MTVSRGRLVGAAAAGVVTCSTLAGCGLLDGSARIEEALEYLPADVTAVQFIDRAAIAERLGLDDIGTGADEAELDRWSRAMVDEPVVSELDRSAAVMQDAAFSAFDLEWEVVASGEDLHLKVWKLSDDVDFDAIADDLLEAGYEQDGADDAPRFSGSLGDVAEPYVQVLLTQVQLVPDERLVIAGSGLDAGLDAVQDDADSLADSGRFADLLDRADDADSLEYAQLASAPACGARPPSSPAQSAQASAGLGHPSGGIAAFVAGEDEPARVVLVFDDEEDAESDAEGREARLDEFADRNGIEADLEVRADGEIVVVETDFADRGVISQAVQRGDGPVACSAGG